MCQRRWMELLMDYDCEIKHHSRKANVVVDTLSRKRKGCSKIVALRAEVAFNLLEEIDKW